MKRMLKEEKELRLWKTNVGGSNRSMFLRDISALTRAVREECAKVAATIPARFFVNKEACISRAELAAAIREGK